MSVSVVEGRGKRKRRIFNQGGLSSGNAEEILKETMQTGCTLWQENCTLEQLEAYVLEREKTLSQALLQHFVNKNRPVSAQLTEIAAKRGYKKSRIRSVIKLTTRGKIRIPRKVFLKKKSKSLSPTDVELNIPPSYCSFNLQRELASVVTSTSFETTVEILDGLGHSSPSKRVVEELVVDMASDFEYFYDNYNNVCYGDWHCTEKSTGESTSNDREEPENSQNRVDIKPADGVEMASTTTQRMEESSPIEAQIAIKSKHDTGMQDLKKQPSNAVKPTLRVITVDGKGIAVLKRDLRPAAKKINDLNTRANDSPSEEQCEQQDGRKRMAEVGAVYEIEPYPRDLSETVKIICQRRRNVEDKKEIKPKAQNKRVWASVEKSVEDVIHDVFSEVKERENKTGVLRVVAVVDGNVHQISCIEKKAKAENRNITVVLDIIHVIEYLYRLMRLFLSESDQKTLGRQMVSKLIELLISSGYEEMKKYIVNQFKMEKRSESMTKAFMKIIAYFERKKEYIKYAEFLEEGLPIASGVIEGACRHLIQDRLGITGAVWSVKTAEAVLKLRSLKASGDFDNYWTFHLKREADRTYERFRSGPVDIAA